MDKILLDKEGYNQFLALLTELNDKLINNAEDDSETEIIKLTGKYLPNQDVTPPEITLNSPLGSAIYLKKIPSTVTYQIGDNLVYVNIIKKIKE